MPSNQNQSAPPSQARMWVATRSRNHRSWLVMTAQPGNSPSASSSEASVSTSRSIGLLVQQQEVAALPEGERQVHPAALPAGQQPGLLLLVGSLGTERRHVRAAGDLGRPAWMKTCPPEITSHTVLSGSIPARSWST